MAEKRKLPPGVPEIFRELMQKPVSFFPAIARLCGNANAGLMWCQGFWWSGNEEVIARGGWFWKSAVEWERETCLSSREQRTARTILLQKGFWEEDKKKVNGAPTLHFKVRFDAVIEAYLAECEAKMEVAETTKQVTNGNCGNDKSIEISETSNPTPDLAKKEIDKSQNPIKEAESTFKEESTSEREGRRRGLSRSERDTMDWKRIAPWFTDKLAPQAGSYIPDRNRELIERAIQSAMNGGVSKERAQELFRQWYPGEPWVDEITRQLPLMGESA